METRASNKRNDNISLISQLEPKKNNEALENDNQVKAIEELKQFDKNNVWTFPLK